MRLIKEIRQILHALRLATGEGDYIRYCSHLRAHHPDRVLPTEVEFYLSRLRDKYTRPSRCC
jgi:uncharacterized short protein YbdD (DUF466 family)